MFETLRGLFGGTKKTKCHYCENDAAKTLVWLKNRRQEPARIQLPWCGCDLMTALKRFWPCPYPVVEGVDYAVEAGICPPKEKKSA